jgi:hypothetical protein
MFGVVGSEALGGEKVRIFSGGMAGSTLSDGFQIERLLVAA